MTKDYFKRLTVKNMTAWDLNCRAYIPHTPAKNKLEKFTKYFVSYIKEHYDFTFTHTEQVKEHWDNDCQKVAGYYNHLENLLNQKQRTVCGELYFCKNFLNK